MKLVFSTLIYLMVLGAIEAQSTLEHKLEDGEYICSGHEFVDNKYIPIFNSNTNEIKICDANFDVMEKIALNKEETYNVVIVSYISKDVFNLDSNFEFLVQTVDALGKSNFKIISDRNDIIMENGEKMTFLLDLKNALKIIVRNTEIDYSVSPATFTQSDEVYSIDGKYHSIRF